MSKFTARNTNQQCLGSKNIRYELSKTCIRNIRQIRHL